MKMGGYIIAQQLQTCGHKESQGIVVISQNHLYHTPGSSDFDPFRNFFNLSPAGKFTNLGI
jgi:hypothetical protein